MFQNFIKIRNMDLAFSSTWLGRDGGRASEIVKAAQSIGLNLVELGPHLNAGSLDGMQSLFIQENLRVPALRYAFIEDGGSQALLEADALAHPRPMEAEKAYTLILKTAKSAKILGAEKIIIQLGCYQEDKLGVINEEIRELYRTAPGSRELEEKRMEALAFIAPRQEAYLDRIIRLLFNLLKTEPEVTFCIENRLEVYELPDLHSLGYIFEDLKSPRLKYWHNVGFNHVQEKLGLVTEGAWLSEFGNRTAGVHLHDAADLDIQLPPGVGEVDFKGILDAIPRDCIRVLDLDPSSSVEAFNLGIEELQRLGY